MAKLTVEAKKTVDSILNAKSVLIEVTRHGNIGGVRFIAPNEDIHEPAELMIRNSIAGGMILSLDLEGAKRSEARVSICDIVEQTELFSRKEVAEEWARVMK